MSRDWKSLRALVPELAEAGDVAAVRRELRAALETEHSPRLFALGRKVAGRLADSLPAVELLVLRSYTVEPLVAPLVTWGLVHGIHIDPTVADYGQFEQVLLAPPGQGDQPGAVLLLSRLEDIAPEVASGFASLSAEDVAARVAEVRGRVSGWLEAARSRYPGALIVVAGLVAPTHAAFGVADSMLDGGQLAAIAALNADLARATAAVSNAFFVDLERVVARVGSSNALDARMNAHARQPYSQHGLSALGESIARALGAAFTPRKKCIVLDCDDTLWGGIVGEDGPDGIALGDEHPGSAFVAFQKALLDIHRRGVLLAIASKNNEADVLEILDDHPYQVLRREHFAACSISWGDKASAIRALAETMNIGLDSMIFIDDSDFECQLVREQLPMVETHQTPENALDLVPLIRGIISLDALWISETDRQRGAMYRAQAARNTAERAAPSLDDFLGSLDLTIETTVLSSDDRALIERAAQLTQRTNQLNATTRRYSAADIEAFVAGPSHDVLMTRVGDRFGDYGWSGLAIVDHATGAIDSFLLSCRVLGRGVEQALAVACEDIARSHQLEVLCAEYIPTAKNHQVADLFDRLGFDPVANEAGGKRYQKGMTSSTLAIPTWFKLVGSPS